MAWDLGHFIAICLQDVDFVEVGLPFMLMCVAVPSKDHVQASRR